MPSVDAGASRRFETLCPLALGLAVAGAVWYFGDEEQTKKIYESMRPSLFTGFFTLSSFLLAAKTFIILNMKKEVYATEVFLKNFKSKLVSINEWPPPEPAEALTVYQGLRETGDLLTANAAVTLLTAVLQFTVGLYPVLPVAAVCLGFAAGAVALVGFSLFYLARNLRTMYVHFEQEAREKMDTFKNEAA